MNTEIHNTPEAVDADLLREIQSDNLNQFQALIFTCSISNKGLVSLTKRAAQENATSIIQYLINEKAALVLAARQGHEAIVTLLIEHGADVNRPDLYGGTALMWAARQGHEAIVTLLIEHGADVNRPDAYAARQGHEAIVTLIIEHGADHVNRPDQVGRTALILAAAAGHEAIVTLLIEHGADVNRPDLYGGTALMWAAVGGHTATVEFLIDRGANVNRLDQSGRTALMWAVGGGDTATVEFLIKHGANVDKPNNAHHTALALVIEDRQEAIDLLLGEAVMGFDSNEEAHQAIDELFEQAGVLTDQREEAHQTIDALLQAGASEEAHQTIEELFEQEAGAGEEIRERIVKLLAQAGGLTYGGAANHQAIAKLLLQAGALSDTGQEDYLADWPTMREYRAALYDTLRPILKKRFPFTDVSSDNLLCFILQAAPRMYAWKRRLLIINQQLEGIFGQTKPFFYSRILLFNAPLVTSPAQHADPLQLVEAWFKKIIANQTQFKSKVENLTLQPETLLARVASLPSEILDNIEWIGQRDRLIAYLERGLPEVLKPYCGQYVPLLVNLISEDNDLEAWLQNSCPLDAVPLENNALAHRSPQP